MKMRDNLKDFIIIVYVYFIILSLQVFSEDEKYFLR